MSPGMRNVEPYPFEELDRRKQEALDAGRVLIDLGVGDPRDETPAFIRDAVARPSLPLVVPARCGSPGVARRDRGLGGSAVRRDARSVDRPHPHAGQQGADLLAGAGDPGSGVGPGPRPRDRARLHDPRTRGAVRGGSGGALAAHGARLPARPRRDRGGHLGAHRHPVAQLPEQPDRRHGAALLPRARRRPGAPSRRLAGAGRGVQRAVVRRRASGLGAAARGSRERRRAQHAEQALEHDGVPLRVHGRRRPVDRGDEGAPPLDRRDAAGVRPTRVRRRLERRGPRAGAASALRREARAVPRPVPAAGRRGRGERGGHVPVGPGARRPPLPHVGARAAGARTRRCARVVLRTGGGGLRPDGDGGDARRFARAVEILESALSEREVHA